MLRSLLFVTGLIAAGISIAGDITSCSPDTVPLQVIGLTRQGPVTAASTFRAWKTPTPPSYFSALMADVRELIATRLANEKLCQGITENKERSLIQFVEWPFSTSQKKLTVPVLPPDTPSSGGCQITSPWLDMAFGRKPVPQIRAIVRWNVRQLLVDQAVLSGAKNVPSGVAMPLMDGDFEGFSRDYVKSEIDGEPAAKPVEERIPPDLLWLFRHSPQTMIFESFAGAVHGLRKMPKMGAEGHRELVLALINRCFDSNGETLHYDSILDVKDLIPLEEYKIDTLAD
ncbi:MAG: hypothetical protein LBE24_08880 [Methylobacillus sp.]|jgi:hypothetical protein|nr:hypothetical protein [Methylobacillus sp.]